MIQVRMLVVGGSFKGKGATFKFFFCNVGTVVEA
jgi:hypothetical protein